DFCKQRLWEIMMKTKQVVDPTKSFMARLLNAFQSAVSRQTLFILVALLVMPLPAKAQGAGDAQKSSDVKADSVAQQATTTTNASTPAQAGQASPGTALTDSVAPVSPAAQDKVLMKPGQPLSLNMQQEDLIPTDDVEMAKKQVLAYPD